MAKRSISVSPQLNFDTVRVILSFTDDVRDLVNAMSVNSIWLRAACSLTQLSWWSNAPSIRADEKRLLALLKCLNKINGFRALEQLSIKSKGGFCNVATVAILKEAGPNLEQLTISHKSNRSRCYGAHFNCPLPLFEVLAKCCPKLKRLDFPGSGWYKAMLTDSLPSGLGSGIPSAEALTGLRQLKLSRIKFKEDSTLQSMLSRLPQLKVLELENVYSDENVEELRIVSASVETIHLIDDGSFEILEIGAPELRAFIISSAERTDETGSWYSTGAELRFLEVPAKLQTLDLEALFDAVIVEVVDVLAGDLGDAGPDVAFPALTNFRAKDSQLSKILGGLARHSPCLEKLRLGCLEANRGLEKLPMTLSQLANIAHWQNLKSLGLYCCSLGVFGVSEEQMPPIEFPRLKELCIGFTQDVDTNNIKAAFSCIEKLFPNLASLNLVHNKSELFETFHEHHWKFCNPGDSYQQYGFHARTFVFFNMLMERVRQLPSRIDVKFAPLPDDDFLSKFSDFWG